MSLSVRKIGNEYGVFKPALPGLGRSLVQVYVKTDTGYQHSFLTKAQADAAMAQHAALIASKPRAYQRGQRLKRA